MLLTEINYTEDLTRLGIPYESVTSPNHGYSGPYTPDCIMPHHTASSSNSGDNFWSLVERHYHFLVGRSGTVGIGGYKKRQGHAGWGNSTKLSHARQGMLHSTNWDVPSASGDDTSSQGNQYACGVCLDVNGVGETPNHLQYTSFTTLIGLMLYRADMDVANCIHHMGYTDRKVDIMAGSISNEQMWDDIIAASEDVANVLDDTSQPDTVVESLFGNRIYDGYWMVDSSGLVKAFGNVLHYGDLRDFSLDAPITNGTAEYNGEGYWLLGEDGGIFAFGSCDYHGSVREALNGGFPDAPCREIISTPSGKGYWILGDDGGIFSFGDAEFHGNWFTGG